MHLKASPPPTHVPPFSQGPESHVLFLAEIFEKQFKKIKTISENISFKIQMGSLWQPPAKWGGFQDKINI